MYRARTEEAQTALSSKYTTFTGYLPPESSTDKSQQETRNALLNSIPESRRPESISTTVDRMFDSNVPVKTTTQITEEIEEAEKTASKYRVERAFIKPDGTLTNNTDPEGVEAFVVFEGKKVARTATGQPIYDDGADTTKEDVQRDLMLFIQNDAL
jgi:hypothetical protein